MWQQKSGARQLQTLWIVFYVSVALASTLGGTVHGFFLDETTLGYKLLWPGTLLAIGITATTAWIIAGQLISGSRQLKKWILFSSFVFFLYAGTVIFYSQSFTVVIFNYIPAMIALLAISVWRYKQTRHKAFLLVTYGILISFAAAFIQQLGISIHPTYFNHNSTYHLLQAFGLWIIFRGAKGLLILERNYL